MEGDYRQPSNIRLLNPNKTGLFETLRTGGLVGPPGFFCPQVPQNSFLWSENWYGNSTTIFQVVNAKNIFRNGRFFVTSPF